MGQREVINFLMKNPNKWYCTKDMLEMGFNVNTLNISIRKLLKNNEIEERVEKYMVGKYVYRDRYIRVRK